MEILETHRKNVQESIFKGTAWAYLTSPILVIFDKGLQAPLTVQGAHPLQWLGHAEQAAGPMPS